MMSLSGPCRHDRRLPSRSAHGWGWCAATSRSKRRARGASIRGTVTPSGSQWVVMAAPIVGTPFHPATSAQAETVAYAAGTSSATIIYFSTDFGSTWPTGTWVNLPSGSGRVFSMVFASSTRLCAGTTTGRLFRIDLSAGTWTATRVDNVAAGALPLAGLVTDIAVDHSDTALNSIFTCFGGTGDFRRVWRFDGCWGRHRRVGIERWWGPLGATFQRPARRARV